jgi:hypothetical protein
MVWGGFNVSGSVYLTLVCTKDKTCHSTEVYAAEVGYENAFMNGTFQGFAPTGFIGMGYESTYWPQFVDYNSSQVNYTVSSSWKTASGLSSTGPQQGVNLAASLPDFYASKTPTVFTTQNVDAAVFEYERF